MEGSFVNNLMSSSGIPKVGGGATFLHWSDRDPGTVVEVAEFKSGSNKGRPRKVCVQYDNWRIVSGSAHDGSAEYEYTRDPEGACVWFTWTGKRWKSEGSSTSVSFGDRSRYQDPHF